MAAASASPLHHPAVPVDGSIPARRSGVMDGDPADVTEKVPALTWLLLETPGINLCRDINGLFLLGWALRVTGREDKATDCGGERRRERGKNTGNAEEQGEGGK